MFDAAIPITTKKVEPYGVLIAIHKIEDFCSERDELCLVDFALEDGVLDSLAVIEAEFGDSPQAARTALARGGDVVSDKDLHGII